jgi:hypothetical protein
LSLKASGMAAAKTYRPYDIASTNWSGDSKVRPLSWPFSAAKRKKSEGAMSGERAGWGLAVIRFFPDFERLISRDAERRWPYAEPATRLTQNINNGIPMSWFPHMTWNLFCQNHYKPGWIVVRAESPKRCVSAEFQCPLYWLVFPLHKTITVLL